MASEKLEIFDLDNNLIKIQDRKIFYRDIRVEYLKYKKILFKVKTIMVILMNSSGRIFLQKRSNSKKENTGLFDKTIGGHVQANDSWDLTMIKECAEELGFPASILSTEDFNKAIKTTNLSIIGIFKEIDLLYNFESTRLIENNKKIIQPFITKIYIGYYDGPIRFVDGESCGIEVFFLNELEKELKRNPEKFTEDIKFMIKKYKNLLVSIQK